jgi:hypothetical protein
MSGPECLQWSTIGLQGVDMGRPTIRVSEWALDELRKRANDEGRTVVSVVDRLLGRVPVGEKRVGVIRPKELVYSSDD